MATGIVAFAFGTPADVYSNRVIAMIAQVNAGQLKAPILTQQDIQFGEGQDFEVSYVQENPGDPPPTLRIAREAMRWAAEKNLDTIVIVAAGPHLWRCLRDMRAAAKEAGRSSLSIVAASHIQQYGNDTWFRPESTQKRTRSKKDWYPREIVACSMPFFIYKRVAS